MAEELKESPSKDPSDKDDMDEILSDVGESEGSLFGEEDPFEDPNSAKSSKDDNALDNVGIEVPEKEYGLRGEGFPQEYVDMVSRIEAQYESLPKLDYDEIYQELSELSVKSCPTPSLQILNDEIQKVQAAKDRLSEIFIEVIKCYNFKKRAVDILKDAWGKFTSKKNAESRKGDGVFRISNFSVDFASTEGLLKACTHILKNLDSLHDSLSRRITIYQLTLKLQDFGRGGLPDFDYDRAPPEEDSIFDEKKSENSEKDDGPFLQNF